MRKAWGLAPFIAAVCMTCHAAALPAEPSLQNLKLQQEIRELELKNEELSSRSSSYGSLITIVLALGTLGGTAIKTLSEFQKNREERRDENRRRADERFSGTVEKLASGSGLPAMMTAATTLTIFLKHEYPHLHEQVFRVMLAALKVYELPNPVKKILVHGFEKAMEVNLKTWKQDATGLDWAGAYFRRIRLNEKDLCNVDIAFSDLSHADLGKSNLHRAKGIGTHLESARLSGCNLQEARLRGASFTNANLHDANLVSARLESADLQGAQFNRAFLQDAHFDGANLTGACFVQANLKNTRFCGAQFDESALKTVLKAYNDTWKKAVFDEDIWQYLCREAGFVPQNHQ